jgi:peroxiredoxin Q/BCP
MVELRKRPAPAAPAPAPKKRAPSKSKAVKTDAPTKEEPTPTANPAAPEPEAKPSPPAAKSSAKVGDTITDLDSFGGEIETNDGEKTTLAKLLAASKSGVVLFTYPKASTPGCKSPIMSSQRNDFCNVPLATADAERYQAPIRSASSATITPP